MARGSGPSVVVRILADATGFGLGVDEAEKGTSRIGSAAAKLGGAVAAGFAIDKVKDFAASSVSAARESEESNKRLEAVFRATGETTGKAAKAAEDYASTLSKQIGVDDEVIKGAQAKLATFKGVSNESARQAGIFDRTTVAAADLAAAGFGTMEGNATQLGKALQDPTKGLAALKRVGVQFTDAQKAQITAMQKSGNVLGAQKIMLKEVETQVGGTAKATATSADKMAVQWDEVQESVGGMLVPVLDKLAGILDSLFTFIANNTRLVTGLAIAFGVVATAIGALVVAQTISASLAAQQGVAYAVVTIATGVWSAAQWLLNAALTAGAVAMSILTSPITLIVVGILALAAALVWAYKNVDWFRAAVDTMGRVAVAGFNMLKDAAMAVFNWMRANWPLLLSIIGGPIGLAVTLVIKNWNTIKSVTMSVFNAVKGVISAVFNAIRSVVGAVSGAIVSVLSAAWNRLKSVTSAVWNGVRSVISGVVGAIRAVVNGLAGFMAGVAARISGIIRGIGSVFHTLGAAASSAVGVVKGVFNGLVGFFQGIVGAISATINRIAGAIKGPINAVINAWNGIRFTIPTINIPKIHIPGTDKDIGGGSFGGQSFGVPHIPTLASGGVFANATLAVVGEGRGREVVAPESLLRSIMAEGGRSGPAVVIQNAEFRDGVDVEVLMRKVAFAIQRDAL